MCLLSIDTRESYSAQSHNVALMPQGRVDVKLGDIEFEYSQPLISTDKEARTVEHELLNDSVVIQHMGTRPTEITIQGACTLDEAATINALPADGVVALRSEQYSGDVMILRSSVDPWDPFGKNDENKILFDYSINCVSVTQAAAAPSVGEGMGQHVYDGGDLQREPTSRGGGGEIR